jgi:uncharacterized LabA/DUF88 family protein
LRTVVFVDGYNLYYGLLRKSKFKWLDLVRLFGEHVLGRENELIQVRYYTAPVLGRMCDDPASPQRQRQYLQAMRVMHPEQLVIVQGKIVATTPYQRMVRSSSEGSSNEKIRVYSFTEKKSDVNLATDLVTGAWKKTFEHAVICSNDTDLEAALQAVKRDHPNLCLGLVAPIASSDYRQISKDLARHATWMKILSPAHLANAQLPDKIPKSKLHRPDSW